MEDPTRKSSNADDLTEQALRESRALAGPHGSTDDTANHNLAADAAIESAERYRLLFESNPIPMWVYDLDTLRFLEVNDAAVRQYGYSRDEFLSMKILDIRPNEEVEKLHKRVTAIMHPFSETEIWKHKKKDGTAIFVEITAHSIELNGRPGRLVLANDVTERHNLETQIRQLQKLEAIGLLAGGIAHDFNNLLTAINGYSELLQRQTPHEDPRRHSVDEILKAGQRAASLTSQLLAFGRKQLLQPKVIDLNAVVHDMGNMLGRLIREDITLRNVFDPELGNTLADPGQVEQVLVNLVVNARDAMPNGGLLTIETKNVYLDDEYARTHISVVPGHYVMIGVSDNGVGMDAETRERIFEPFFTTKEKDRGTGLGLSTTYGIVKQSGGNIWVYSEPGKGSTFKIYFPRAEQDVPVPSVRDERLFDLQGSETILLAEDDEIVRKLALHILETHGYIVHSAETGLAAVEFCDSFEGKIDLLVTDVVMPGMSGRELAETISIDRPGTRILFMSGYTDTAAVHHGDIDVRSNFIQKPFSVEAFARKIRDVLDGS